MGVICIFPSILYKFYKYIPKTKGQYLLTLLIRCICGASHSVNKLDVTYTCRIKHKGVEKGLKHSPDIKGSFIESLAWYVALQEFHQEMSLKQEDVKVECEKEINHYGLKVHSFIRRK